MENPPDLDKEERNALPVQRKPMPKGEWFRIGVAIIIGAILIMSAILFGFHMDIETLEEE